MILLISSTYRVGERYKKENFPVAEYHNIRVITSREQLWPSEDFEYILVFDDIPIKNKVLTQLDFLVKIGRAKRYEPRTIQA